MPGTDTALRDDNVALAPEIMTRFGRDMNGWYDYLHDDCVMEFPFGPSVGMPKRVEGKAGCSAVFRVVCDVVQVQFSNIRVMAMADPSKIVVEYNGYSEPNGEVYDQTYICVQEYRDGKMILFREYWDAAVVRDTFGDLSGLAG